jgi:hypothetical protein
MHWQAVVNQNCEFSEVHNAYVLVQVRFSAPMLRLHSQSSRSSSRNSNDAAELWFYQNLLAGYLFTVVPIDSLCNLPLSPDTLACAAPALLSSPAGRITSQVSPADQQNISPASVHERTATIYPLLPAIAVCIVCQDTSAMHSRKSSQFMFSRRTRNVLRELPKALGPTIHDCSC